MGNFNNREYGTNRSQCRFTHLPLHSNLPRYHRVTSADVWLHPRRPALSVPAASHTKCPVCGLTSGQYSGQSGGSVRVLTPCTRSPLVVAAARIGRPPRARPPYTWLTGTSRSAVDKSGPAGRTDVYPAPGAPLIAKCTKTACLIIY